jgi:hypothetical protein
MSLHPSTMASLTPYAMASLAPYCHMATLAPHRNGFTDALLPWQVDAAMLTRLGASQVPVTYLRRSSIAMWGSAPVVWNASGLLALAASRRASAVFVARNCASRNGREQARLATPPRRQTARRATRRRHPHSPPVPSPTLSTITPPIPHYPHPTPHANPHSYPPPVPSPVAAAVASAVAGGDGSAQGAPRRGRPAGQLPAVRPVARVHQG